MFPNLFDVLLQVRGLAPFVKKLSSKPGGVLLAGKGSESGYDVSVALFLLIVLLASVREPLPIGFIVEGGGGLFEWRQVEEFDPLVQRCTVALQGEEGGEPVPLIKCRYCVFESARKSVVTKHEKTHAEYEKIEVPAPK